jgi:RNA recognition motif-containing protein
VANFDEYTDEQDLEILFGNYGRVNDVMIWINSESGKPAGWGFVEMGHDDDAERAIERLDGRYWNGRRLKVSKARSQQ